MTTFPIQKVRTVAKTSLTVAVLLAGAYTGIWQWMICRTEVPPGFSLLVRYKGPWPFGSSTMAPEGTLVQNAGAGRPVQVGILEDMPGPGRHFYSPLEYETHLVKDQVIAPGKIGVVVSKIGKPLPEGAYLVDAKGYRGILRKVLTPGRYRINTYAYDVKVVDVDACTGPSTRLKRTPEDPTLIPPGYVGVVTNKASDPATGAGRGIQQQILQPGIYFLNPEEKRIDIVSIGYSETSLTVEAQKQDSASAAAQARQRRTICRATAWARRRPTTRIMSPAKASSFPRATAFRSTSTTRRSGVSCPPRRLTWFGSSVRSRMSRTR